MERYVDSGYYKDSFGGKIPPGKVNSCLAEAHDDVDAMTYYRIHKIGFGSLTPFQQERVRRAVCYQAEHIYQRELARGMSGYSIGDVSVSLADSGAARERYSSCAASLLDAAGLTYRGGVL